MSTSSVWLPIQDESLYVFPNCKSLWIKVSAKWLNVNVNVMAFYIDCIHTDICEQSVITCWLSAIKMLIIQIQAIPHKTRKHIWKLLKKKRKKRFICAKKAIAKLRPHQMTGVSQRASRAVARERQNSNKQSSVYLWLFFFFGWSHSVWDIACYKIMLFFLPPRRCFWA